MELELTEDQQFFQETTKKFLETESPLSTVRALEHDPAGYTPEYWKRGAELGWTSMLVPEADGGGNLSGEGLLDLALVAEEMGRLVSPGPLLPTNVVADAVARSGSAEQKAAVLPGILGGETVAAWCHTAVPGIVEGGRATIEATPDGADFVLSGTASPVEAAGQAGHLLVTAVAPGGDNTVGDTGLTQFLVAADAPGVTVTPLGCVDLVRRFAAVRFDGVKVPASAVVGDVGGAEAAVRRQFAIAVALQCAETAGVTDRVLEFTLAYADDRYSFGRPISSYQALKHRFADMKMWLEACHATTTAAAKAVQRDKGDGTGDGDELVSVAKAWIGSTATEIIQDCVQMHGGIGVTWEHDIHLYLRRATLNRGMYGTGAQHRERLAVILGMGDADHG